MALSVRREHFHLSVSLNLPTHGVTAIWGPSGSGKSTLLRAIAGLEREATGTLQVGDEQWQGPEVMLPAHQRSLGCVFQQPSLFPHLNIEKNLVYGERRVPRKQNSLLPQAIQLLDIAGLLKRMPHQLSIGEQQRVAIARAIAMQPSLLLLDEPCAALDQDRKQDILPYLHSLHRKLHMPMLYVSHSRDEVAQLADYLVVLDNGQATASGPVVDLFTDLALPLAHATDAQALVEAVVTECDEPYGLVTLSSSGTHFVVSGEPLPTGSRVRLRVRASDVSIALTHQDKSSILNVFQMQVDTLAPTSRSRMMVRLQQDALVLLASITRKSCDDMQLSPGTTVLAQIKSVALLT